MESAPAQHKPGVHVSEMVIPDVDKIFDDMKSAPDTYAEAMRAIESGKDEVVDAVLFCGRFSQSGILLRESSGAKPYRLLHVRGHEAYNKAMCHLRECWARLPAKMREAQIKADWQRYKREKLTCGIRKARENWGGAGFSGGGSGGLAPYFSNSDLGSNSGADPNQFTEFTPWFSGPFYKNIPYAYFPGMAASREAVNHHPVAHRIIDVLCQYSLGRGFAIRCKNNAITDKWDSFAKSVKLKNKIRKFWGREYLIDGELTIDKARMISVDASTIMDIVCEGFDEYVDRPLYLQQMFETATQTYAGIEVPGVPKSKDSKPGKWIVRQIPADQVIRIKTNCTSQDKRGRPVIFSVFGWLKKYKDAATAKVLSEQLAASFVFDDEIDGSAADVAAHGQRYNYIPVAPSVFVHNKSVKRTALQQTGGGRTGGGTDIAQEILALIATAMGFPKDFFNVMSQGSGSRATAIVGSEPFTKVIEDLQQDFEELLDSIIEYFCQQNDIKYNEHDWQIIFPSVSKDSAKDFISNVATAEEMGYINKRRAATMVAAELECDNFDFDEEQEKGATDTAAHPPINPGVPPPAGRFGAQMPQLPGAATDAELGAEDNPIHGSGKQAIKKAHKKL